MGGSTEEEPTPGPASSQPLGALDVTAHCQNSKARKTNLKMPEMNCVPLRPRMKRIT